ncbi:GPH family glycoside/pentoside/hexuronide:cation symporter [Microbacterium natoriense]|uniref:GPH family glycoside/pentoside/hexuronide:cation symporter n=1 Tax=Microbacterium natoriense TaxID=284570 RepID=A0AAW8F550_9MICO|nr:MFS transporter [Microbacterium natoriense]MDQ0649576.1 GPH family glycoside/pentoside/hexuronide:cation symporter [Microbacterium natoriense]
MNGSAGPRGLAGIRDRRLDAAPTRAQSIAFGASGFPTQLMAQTFSAFVVYFYVTHLGVPPTWVAGAMIVHGVLNAALNPAVGALSDRIRTPWGRRIPWIGLGIVPLVVAFALVWMPPALSPGGMIVWFLVVVAVYDIAFVVVVLNISALFPEIFRTTEERARGNVPRQIFAILGMVLGTAGAPALYGWIGWPGMALALGGVCLVMLLWSFAGGMIERAVPEAASEAMSWQSQLRFTFANRAFVPYVLGSLFVQTSIAVILAAIPFYVRYSLHAAEGDGSVLLAAIFVTAIPSILLWSAVVRRTSPRTAVLWSVAVFGVAVLGYLLPASVLAAALVGVAVGVGVGGLLQLLEVMLGQIIDEDAVRTGHRREGAFFGVNGFVVRGSVVLQAIVAAAVLTASGFDASRGDAQAETVDGGIRIMLAVVPLGFTALAWLCFWLYPIRTRDL